MTQPTDDFVELLARARRQDAAAMAELVRRYESKIRLVARVLLGPALRPYFDSLDLVQSVHRSLMLGMRHDKYNLTSPEQLLALTTTLLRRKVARKWRHMRRQQRLEPGSAETGNVPALLTSLCSSAEDPALAAQFQDGVRHLWDNLNASEQRLIELRLQGYSTGEIAADLGLTGVALRVRMTRLRQRLRDSGVLDDWL
jgi:RNA polymerase sigma-70 factor (ECF subfamily)